jgi:hypothetical protein
MKEALGSRSALHLDPYLEHVPHWVEHELHRSPAPRWCT